VLSAPSPRRKSAPASANCMSPVAGHRLRIVFESHANRCDRLAIIPVQCRERSCTARPRAGAREIPATSSLFQPEAIKSCKNPPSRATLFHFLGLLDAFGWLTDGLQSLLAVRIHLAPPCSPPGIGVFGESIKISVADGKRSGVQIWTCSFQESAKITTISLCDESRRSSCLHRWKRPRPESIPGSRR
jgi:hypothetical protein